MKLVKTTNRLALFSLAALIYWVFAFICINAFGLKIFQKNLTEIFFMSVLGLFALLAGALILNIMLNLSRMADAAEGLPAGDSVALRTLPKAALVTGVLLFPLLFGLMYWGDYSTVQHKRRLLIQAVERLVAEEKQPLAQMAAYRFEAEHLQQTANSLKLMTKSDESIQHMVVIVPDTVQNKPVWLNFGAYDSFADGQKVLQKEDFIYAASADERAYLQQVFAGQTQAPRYSAYDGHYELYYPVQTANGRLVLYVTDNQRYGKVGSS